MTKSEEITLVSSMDPWEISSAETSAPFELLLGSNVCVVLSKARLDVSLWLFSLNLE